jgi:hypothetical protein
MMHRLATSARIWIAGGLLAVPAIVCAAAPGVDAPPSTGEVRILVQSSPLAGIQFYTAKQWWSEMQVGNRLELVRESANRHDANAIRVEWRGHKLGYVPRRENQAVAREMDRGAELEARISKLQRHRSPWQRLRMDIYVVR